MTPERRAKEYSNSKKCIDWVNTDPLAKAWMEGHKANADSYVLEATTQGMKKIIEDQERHIIYLERLLYGS
jgi:hypothetical protein